MKREAFLASFAEINKNFKQIFQELSRGDGDLVWKIRKILWREA